jgi:hypothetical protein
MVTSGGPGCKSGLFDGDGVLFTDFDAALTAKAFLGVHRHGLAVFHLENFYRTNVNTLFATDAFFCIYRGNKCHLNCLL